MAQLGSILGILTLSAVASAQTAHNFSGGVLKLEQAAYDVQSYDISLDVNPTTRTLKGRTVMVAKTVIPTISILVDLDDSFTVNAVTDGTSNLRYDRIPGAIRIYFPKSRQPGDAIRTDISYGGTPVTAKNAPWDGGFVWSKAGNQPWFGVALQGEGGDLLFPCKDHPSDRPNQAVMRLTVPQPLTAVGPGVLRQTVKNADGTSTFVWHMPLPINNYSLVFNAAPYKLTEDTYRSSGGQTIPLMFYMLPTDSDANVRKLIAEQKKYLAFMEKFCGPYPFRAVKLGVVETAHLGMEHSTAIAYGNRFRFADGGLDWLLLHEFGHEWWANLVSNADWRDMWIHEGIQSYMDTFYIEQLRGKDAYLAGMRQRTRAITNAAPIAPREQTSSEAYGGDIYDKGALMLHSLRYLVGDEAFLRTIRRMAYPTPEMEKWADGRAQRLVTTDDFVFTAEREAKRDLHWFFEVYARQAKLPKLVTEVTGNRVTLRWEAPDNLPFPMPIDLVVDGKRVRVPMTDGKGEVTFTGTPPVIDPDGWVLREPTRP